MKERTAMPQRATNARSRGPAPRGRAAVRTRIDRLEREAARFLVPDGPEPVLSRVARATVSRVRNAVSARFRQEHGRAPAGWDEIAAACTDAELDELDRLDSAALGVDPLPALVR
jgi:hypothetical protein